MQVNIMKPMIAIKTLTMNIFAHVSSKHLTYKFIQMKITLLKQWLNDHFIVEVIKRATSILIT